MIFNKITQILFLFLFAFMSNGRAINRGLVNQGNSCYMNAALQCITHVQPFVEYLKAHPDNFNTDQQVVEFINLINNNRDTTNQQDPAKIAAFSPSAFYNLSFVGAKYSQQDSSEFFIPLLDKINELDIQPSIVQKTFGFKQVSRLTCPSCKHTSDSIEELLDMQTFQVKSLKNSLELPLPAGENLTLNQLLNGYFTQEKLDDANRWKCSGCSQYVKATKQLLLQNAPEFLIVALKRFPAPHQKDSRPVSFPRTHLNLKEFIANKQDTLYELMGIVIHHGGAGGGHYFAYCRDYKNGQWYKFDDSSVSFANNVIDGISKQAIDPGGPYILFYQRQAAQIAQPEPVQPIAPKPEQIFPISPESKPIPQEPKRWPIIDDIFAKQLATLQLTTAEKKAYLASHITGNSEYYFARTQDGKSPLHLFVDFLKGITEQKSNLELIRDGYEINDDFFEKDMTIQDLNKEFEPQTYFEYLEFLVENFDVNLQLPNTHETVLHLLIKDSSLQADLNRDDQSQFLNLLLILLVQKTNLNLQDKEGKTPFYLLIEKLSPETENLIYTLFFKYKIHLDIPAYNHRTILHCLLSKNKIDNPFLTKNDIILNTLNLFLNAEQKNFSNANSNPAKALCELVKSQDIYGKTPLHYALEKDHIEAAKILIELLFKNNKANDAFFNLTSNSYGESPGKSIKQLIDQKNLTVFTEELKKQNAHQEETVTPIKEIITNTFNGIVQKLHQNTRISEKIKKLEANDTLQKIKQEIIEQTQTSTKPLENKDILDLITKKLTHALTQPQDPLSEKLNLLKQRLTMLKTKLGQLRNSLEFLKKALS